VTDAGLARLRGPNRLLETLGLNNTEVTDDGLAYLKDLTKLKLLYLSGAQVTEEGVADLKRALPGLKIVE